MIESNSKSSFSFGNEAWLTASGYIVLILFMAIALSEYRYTRDIFGSLVPAIFIFMPAGVFFGQARKIKPTPFNIFGSVLTLVIALLILVGTFIW